MAQQIPQRVTSGTLVFLLAVLAGCGPKRNEPVPVTGVVTMDGGRVPGAGRLYFTADKAAEGVPLRPGVAVFNEQGRFAAKSFRKGDGLLPGTYRVGAECWKTMPTMEGPPAESYLPPKYQSPLTSGWEVVVEPGSKPIEVTFDIVTK